MKGRPSVLRAAVLVAFGALLQAVLAPELSFWWVAPNFLVLALVAAVPGFGEIEGLLLGFFGGILVDILSAGLFGAGAFGGLVVGAVSARLGRGKLSSGREVTRFFVAWVSVLAVVAYTAVRLAFLALGGEGVVPLGGFLVLGLLTSALVNGLISFVLCRPLMRLTRVRGER